MKNLTKMKTTNLIIIPCQTSICNYMEKKLYMHKYATDNPNIP